MSSVSQHVFPLKMGCTWKSWFICVLWLILWWRKINKGIHFYILNVPGKIRVLSNACFYALHFQRWMGLNEIRLWLGYYPKAFFLLKFCFFKKSRLEGSLLPTPWSCCLPTSVTGGVCTGIDHTLWFLSSVMNSTYSSFSLLLTLHQVRGFSTGF